MFTNRLNELIEEKKINKAILGRNLNIPKATINNWFNRGSEPTSSNIIKLADYFQVTTDYLLGREDYGTGLIEIKQEPTEWERKIRDGRSQEEVREITFICEAYIQSEETYKSKIVGYITRCLEEQGKLSY